jgi:hypothetical protein
VTGPLVCADLYAAVTGRFGRCECHQGQPGSCGRKHPAYGVACQMPARPGAPLIAAPMDPALPLHRATALGVDGLMALCRDCYARRASTARKAAEAVVAARAAEAQSALF